MTIFDSLLLGFIQGITEFLPVSSSGHLIIFRSLFGITSPPLVFDLILHFATTLAAIVFFFNKIIKLKLKHIAIIIISNIPVGIVGVLFKDQIEVWFNSLLLVSFTIFITGVINLLSDFLISRQNKVDSIKVENEFPNFKKGLIVGIFQMIAITPGISRSGSTVFAGLLSGLNKEVAFNFSFLLVMPAIIGATLLELKDVGFENEIYSQLPIYLSGATVAFLIGMLSLFLLKKLLVSSKWKIFGIYCIFLGFSLLIGQFLELI